MTDKKELDDINVADLTPPADPIALAEAVKRLNDEVKEGDKIMREIAEILAPYVGGEIDSSDMDLHETADAVALNVVGLTAKLASAQRLVETLKRNLDSKTHECEALRKSLEAAQSRGDDRPIAGYMTADTMLVFQALDEARKQAESAVVSRDCRDQEITVYELRLIGTAKRTAEWVPA